MLRVGSGLTFGVADPAGPIPPAAPGLGWSSVRTAGVVLRHAHSQPTEDPLTEDRRPPADLLAKAGDSDVLRSVATAVLQRLMAADVEGLIGAGRHERTGERLNDRNGLRDRTLDTRLAALRPRVPKLLQGSYPGICAGLS